MADGSCVFDHDLKAGALWTAFKERLGVSEFSGIQFDLPELLHTIPLPK